MDLGSEKVDLFVRRAAEALFEAQPWLREHARLDSWVPPAPQGCMYLLASLMDSHGPGGSPQSRMTIEAPSPADPDRALVLVITNDRILIRFDATSLELEPGIQGKLERPEDPESYVIGEAVRVVDGFLSGELVAVVYSLWVGIGCGFYTPGEAREAVEGRPYRICSWNGTCDEGDWSPKVLED
jgi:hypothetical protein